MAVIAAVADPPNRMQPNASTGGPATKSERYRSSQELWKWIDAQSAVSNGPTKPAEPAKHPFSLIVYFVICPVSAMRASRRELTTSFAAWPSRRSWLHDEPVAARIESNDADVRHGVAVHFPDCHL
jgi:hypothetical protein